MPRLPGIARRRNRWGIWIRTPSPSPVLSSQPQAPRWSRFLQGGETVAHDLMRDRRLLMLATKPTPHESCSLRGS